MARRAGTREPGASGFIRFSELVRAASRTSTTTAVVTETVTEMVTERIPATVPERVPTAVPAAETEPPQYRWVPEQPGTAAVRDRDVTLRPDRAQVKSWARRGGLAAAGCLAWWLLDSAGDPVVAALGWTLGVFSLPVLLWVVASVVFTLGMWASSRVVVTPEVPAVPAHQELASPDAQNRAQGSAQSLAHGSAPDVPMITRQVPKEVKKRVRKTVAVDADTAVEQAMTGVRTRRYDATVPGVTLSQEVLRVGVGSVSEERVGRLLEKLPETWEVAHDLDVLKRGRDTDRGYDETDISANIDHLLSGPAGLVMVDTKSWAGILGVRRKKLYRKDKPKWSGKRGVSPETLLYEAASADYGMDACQVSRIVIAVTDGSVDAPDGVLEVPYPTWSDEDLPVIPITAVVESKLLGYLTGLPAKDEEPATLESVVNFSPRLGWN